MKLYKPAWISHDGQPIFSIDIHPDKSRFVTGGQGFDSTGRVVIWDMSPILEREGDVDDDDICAKILCQLDHHNACVNCVRWSNCGHLLASGGDDRIIIIWKLMSKVKLNKKSQSKLPNAFGAPAQEIWKPIHRLQAHVGDILDLSWSPEDKYLASASIDNRVIVWDAVNFPQIITELKGHTSLVKGVTWDPVGNYIATQSDDKTLRIWRTSDWEIEQIIQAPFLQCGGTTHVLRLDWSPDGLYLVSAHAMNNGGPTAQIIERNGWKAEKDYVGHRKAICCVRFNKPLMELGKDQMSYLALGSRDTSISIWSTAYPRPITVIKEVFESSVMDLTWSSCGSVLMGCSSDGTVAVVRFSSGEIGRPMTTEETEAVYRNFYGNTKSAAGIVQSIEVFMARKKERSHPTESSKRGLVNPSANTTGNPKNLLEKELAPRGPDKQLEMRTGEGKRRITPKFVASSYVPDEPSAISSIFKEAVEPNQVQTVTGQISTNNLRDNMVSGIEGIRAFDSDINMDTSDHQRNQSGMSKDSNTQNHNDGKLLDRYNQQGSPNPIQGRRQSICLEKIPESFFNGNVLPPESVPATSSTTKPDTSVDIRINGHGSDSNKLKQDGKSGQKKKGPKTNHIPVPSLYDPTYKEKEVIDDILNLSKSKGQGPSSGKGRPSSLVPSPDMQAPPPKVPKRTKCQSKVCMPQPLNRLNMREDYQNTQISPNQIRQTPPRAAGPRARLEPLKIETVFTTFVTPKSEISYTLEVNNQRSISSYILKCTHEMPSYNGLEWSIATEGPICGAAGNSIRVVILCEDATVHILNLKGYYVFPPLVISSSPSRLCLSGIFLLVATTKATIHLWNIQQKKTVIKSESLAPLMNQHHSETGKTLEVSVLNVTANGTPLVTLSNGKSFMFSLDLQSWMVFIGSSVARFGRDKILALEPVMIQDTILRKKTNRSEVITKVKLKLAAAIELKNSDDVREWLLMLGKTYASQGLEKELHQLCEDLLGPTHSSARNSKGWASEIVGIKKREVLQELLSHLINELKWQDLFCEFNDGLEMVNQQN